MTHEEMLMRLDKKVKEIDAKVKEIDGRLKRLEEDESFFSILKTIKEELEDKDG